MSFSLDLLKAEIASKKRTLDHAATGDAAPQKYFKRTDLDHRSKAIPPPAAALVTAARNVAQAERDHAQSLGVVPAPDGDGADSQIKVEHAKPDAFNVAPEEAVRRLRAKGEPTRLFGESDKDRRLRLRALELIEERTDGQRNDFMRALDGMEKGLDLQELAKRATKGAAASASASASADQDDSRAGDDSTVERKPRDENVVVALALVKSNPYKVYPQIYFALKRTLKEWEQSLAEQPETVKRSTQGKLAAATQQTSAEYLKPLFKALRKRDLEPDVLQAIAEITHNMQIREYVKANDAYLRLSIGNAPWPIGVTMVGIHERSGREKIFSNNVAHVLNDETSRKYIQSLKRLLTFTQSIRPPDDGSQKMG